MAQVAPNNAAVSSLLETAVSYDASMSIASESERSMATFKRRTCICHMGDACQIMSTAYRTNKDPRGCFVMVPSYEVQLREAYCRHLLPNASSKQIDDIDDEFVVAVHHFHPTIIDRCFDTDPNNHQEDDILPMPARTVSGGKALEHLLSDTDKVFNHQTGTPTGEYWVVPSYPFDSAHGDLKDSMGKMEQLALERCIRRMKREARRQKWEAVVDKWEAVSKRSHRSISTEATEGLTVPSSPATTGSRSSIQPPKVIVQVGKVPAPPVSVGVQHSSCLQGQLDELDAAHNNNKLRGLGIINREDEESERRGSMMTAQEVLQTEMGDSDEESLIDDLHTVDEPPADMPIETKPIVVAPKAPESPTRKDDGSMSSLSQEESSRGSPAKPASPIQPRVLVVNKPEIKAKPVEVKTIAPPAVPPPPKPVDPRHAEMRKALDTLINAKEQQLAAAKTPEGVPKNITGLASKKPQVDPLLGTPPSEQTKKVVTVDLPPATTTAEVKTAAPKATPTITLPASNKEPQQVAQSNTQAQLASTPADAFKATATKAFVQGRAFLKSQAGTAVAVGLYCVFAVQVVSTLSHCRGVLRSRGEAFEYY